MVTITEIEELDPRIRFTKLKELEFTLLQNIEKKERELKIILSELKAVRILLEQALDDLSDAEAKESQEKYKEQTKRIESIELIVGQAINAVKLAKAQTNDSKIKSSSVTQTYVRGAELSEIVGSVAINRLRELAYETDWTQDDAREYQRIRDSVRRAREYNLSDVFQSSIDETYEALRLVSEMRNPQEEQYKPNFSTQSQQRPENFDNQRPNISRQSTTTNLGDNLKETYSPSSNINIAPVVKPSQKDEVKIKLQKEKRVDDF